MGPSYSVLTAVMCAECRALPGEACRDDRGVEFPLETHQARWWAVVG